jgi:4-hydroxy-3-methylbut-2-en-1-yl diphosphate synthase IspG/GcpE
MKSSDTDVMIRSTRMLVGALMSEGLAYPIHLGVTEAGEGEDGRIRSAAGIGALLQDGIGDTIRVSLSEDPEKEIPIAKKLAEFFPREKANTNPQISTGYKAPDYKPDLFRGIYGPLVMADFRSLHRVRPDNWLMAGFRKNAEGAIIRSDFSADLILADSIPEDLPEEVRLAVPYDLWVKNRQLHNVSPFQIPLNPTRLNKTGIPSDLSAPLGERDSQREGLNIILSDPTYGGL